MFILKINRQYRAMLKGDINENFILYKRPNNLVHNDMEKLESYAA